MNESKLLREILYLYLDLHKFCMMNIFFKETFKHKRQKKIFLSLNKYYMNLYYSN